MRHRYDTLEPRLKFYLAITIALVLAFLLAVARSEEWKPHKTDLARWGLPEGNWCYRGEFVLAYDGRSRLPRWVMECLVADAGAGDAVRKNAFRADQNIPPEFRASPTDYEGLAGFDRGHMAPAADYGEQADQDETFLLSNIAPQASELNRGLWAKLEKHVRSLAVEGATVWALTCPIFDDRRPDLKIRRVGPNQVWVPTHFAKAVLVQPEGDSPPTLLTWIIPNESPADGAALDDFLVAADEMERRAGLDLWSKLPAALQTKLEAAQP